MESERFILYSNRNHDRHICTYISPEGEVNTLDSKELPDLWEQKLSLHHVMVRMGEENGCMDNDSDSWNELIRIPWMKRNEELED